MQEKEKVYKASITTVLEAFLQNTVFGIKRKSHDTKKQLVYQYKGFLSSNLEVTTQHAYQMMEKDIRKEMEALTAAIATEHYNITKSVDQNLNYLWYMYHKGTKAGTFKPFVYMAELQLLKRMKYVTDDEAKNMFTMLESEDQDNLHLVTLSIKSFRSQRIKEHGEYTDDNKDYAGIAKSYAFEILNHEVFMKTMAVR